MNLVERYKIDCFLMGHLVYVEDPKIDIKYYNHNHVGMITNKKNDNLYRVEGSRGEKYFLSYREIKMYHIQNIKNLR